MFGEVVFSYCVKQQDSGQTSMFGFRCEIFVSNYECKDNCELCLDHKGNKAAVE